MHHQLLLPFALAAMLSASVSLADNCDVRSETGACALRPDAAFERIDATHPVAVDATPVPHTHLVGCDASTDREAIAQQTDLTVDERNALAAPTGQSTMLVNARIDGVRWIFLAPDDVALGWSPNPDRVALRLPGQLRVQDYLVDSREGPARWCPTTQVFSVTAHAPDAASVQLQSNPATQDVSVGDTAFLQIKIINNGTVALAPVAVTSSAIPSCARTLSSLGAGFTYTYTCNLNNVQQTTSNTVSATGSYTGGSVSATATSTITVDGEPPPSGSGSAKLAICRLPWVQFARVGEQAHWEITVTNTSAGALQNVVVNDPQNAACNTTIASMNAGQAVVYSCSTTVTGATPWRYFTTTAGYLEAGVQTQEIQTTNGVITDHIAVNGFDGCVLGGTSTDFCRPANSYAPMLRRPTN